MTCKNKLIEVALPLDAINQEAAMLNMVKKTMQMKQEYIDRLREIFGTRTEKEAVNKAMDGPDRRRDY